MPPAMQPAKVEDEVAALLARPTQDFLGCPDDLLWRLLRHVHEIVRDRAPPTQEFRALLSHPGRSARKPLAYTVKDGRTGTTATVRPGETVKRADGVIGQVMSTAAKEGYMYVRWDLPADQVNMLVANGRQSGPSTMVETRLVEKANYREVCEACEAVALEGGMGTLHCKAKPGCEGES
eukprot:g5199.t1